MFPKATLLLFAASLRLVFSDVSLPRTSNFPAIFNLPSTSSPVIFSFHALQKNTGMALGELVTVSICGTFVVSTIVCLIYYFCIERKRVIFFMESLTLGDTAHSISCKSMVSIESMDVFLDDLSSHFLRRKQNKGFFIFVSIVEINCVHSLINCLINV